MPKEYMPLTIFLMIILMLECMALIKKDLPLEWVDRLKKATVSTIIAAAVVVGWILWE